MYASTSLTNREICDRSQVPFAAFSSWLCRNHRDLLLRRHNLESLKNVKLRGSKGQTTAAHLKYHDAIAAADSLEYIEYNISRIARLFGLESAGLANQLRHHYPDVLTRREGERRRLGINDNIHHGVRPRCEESYAAAVESLQEACARGSAAGPRSRRRSVAGVREAGLSISRTTSIPLEDIALLTSSS